MDKEETPLEERRADPTAQHENDEAILDYVAYKAIKALLNDFKNHIEAGNAPARKPKAGLHLDLVDCKLNGTRLCYRAVANYRQHSLLCSVPCTMPIVEPQRCNFGYGY